jgi:hypothetical protein
MTDNVIGKKRSTSEDDGSGGRNQGRHVSSHYDCGYIAPHSFICHVKTHKMIDRMRTVRLIWHKRQSVTFEASCHCRGVFGDHVFKCDLVQDG